MVTLYKSPGKMTPHRFGGAGVIFLLIILTAGCGIPNYAYLDPPKNIVKFNSTTPSASFTNVTDNNPDIFQGYQLYGKFYSSSGEIDSEATSATNFSRLLGLDFLRLVSTPDGINASTGPVVFFETEAEKSQNTTFTLNFTGDISASEPGFNTVITNNNDSDEITIARRITLLNIADPVLKGFQKDDLDPEHSDLDELSLPAGEDSLSFIYLSVFVLSFGRESDGYTAVYSEPVYLGYVELPVDVNAVW